MCYSVESNPSPSDVYNFLPSETSSLADFNKDKITTFVNVGVLVINIGW